MINQLLSKVADALQTTKATAKRDMIRGGALSILLAYLYFTDPNGFAVVTYMISLMAIIALFSHFMRRVIFPYLDMRVLMKEVTEQNNQGAAIIFVGICFIIGMLILSVGGMLQ